MLSPREHLNIFDSSIGGGVDLAILVLMTLRAGGRLGTDMTDEHGSSKF